MIIKKNNIKNRISMIEQDPKIRKKNFNEVPIGYSIEMAQDEASRCLQCKKPACVSGCPVEVKIPEFIKLIVEKNYSKAAISLWSKNSLPAVCGRVCPQEIQCEGRCILAKKNKSIAIGNLERFIADWAIENKIKDSTKKIFSTGKKVAIIGSGPSSLTVAGDLIKKGHEITILEAFHKPGGVLIYGIPEFRLPKKIVEYEINNLINKGLKIEVNKVVGRTITVDELFKKENYDAVYLGVGAGLPKFMNIPGENLNGILSANEYLTRANLMKAYKFPKFDTPMPKGENVVVIGGGNVAMDSARTAIRLGAKSVQIIYRRSKKEMPARLAEIHHAEEEGIKFTTLTNPVKFIGDKNGLVRGIECIEMNLGERDNSGRKKPIPVKNSEFIINSDLVIVSVGAGANPLLTKSTPDIKLNKFGYIETNSKFGKTSKKGVWAGGDIVTGAATVILAMGAGRLVAKSINDFLTLGW